MKLRTCVIINIQWGLMETPDIQLSIWREISLLGTVLAVRIMVHPATAWPVPSPLHSHLNLSFHLNTEAAKSLLCGVNPKIWLGAVILWLFLSCKLGIIELFCFGCACPHSNRCRTQFVCVTDNTTIRAVKLTLARAVLLQWNLGILFAILLCWSMFPSLQMWTGSAGVSPPKACTQWGSQRSSFCCSVCLMRNVCLRISLTILCNFTGMP